jgi:hypothetical protein
VRNGEATFSYFLPKREDVCRQHTSSPGRQRENSNTDTEGVMKDTSGLIVSAVLMLCGASVLLTTLRSGEKEIALIGDVPIVWGFALVIGLIGLVGGVIVLTTTRSKRRSTAKLPPVNG